MPKCVFAKASVSFRKGAESFRIQQGVAYEATHPAVLANPGAFQDDPIDYVRAPSPKGEPQVEQATAAPGEKRRGLRRSDIPSGGAGA